MVLDWFFADAPTASRFFRASPATGFASAAIATASLSMGCAKTPETMISASGSTSITFTDSNTTGTDSETSGASSETAADSADATSTESGLDDTSIPDFPPIESGCIAVDLLFVVDNSESMGMYQSALTAAFPDFIDSLWSTLPGGVDLHVGITSTDFAGGCTTPEATALCQSTASAADIIGHYNQPTNATGNGVPGSQGRLYFFDSRPYFEANTDDPPDALKTWFTGAATSAGESGCSFEMPVAAASWAASAINTGPTGTNAGFFRDEGSLLVVFFLTDEPDKSPEGLDTHKQRLLDIKQECGGESCIFMAGLIPPCILDVNQKLWQFMDGWGHPEPAPWADILQVNMYGQLVGQALADLLADKCAEIPPVD
jgi:hypothetical protein